VQRFKCHNRFK